MNFKAKLKNMYVTARGKNLDSIYAELADCAKNLKTEAFFFGDDKSLAIDVAKNEELDYDSGESRNGISCVRIWGWDDD